MKPARFDYHRARDLPDALSALQDPDAKIIAGGQSLGPMLNLRLARPGLLIDIGRVAELRTVREDGVFLRIGAAVTHAAIEDGAAQAAACGFLNFVASHIAYRPIRNRGTIGGSLAHADPAADWPTALTALDAEAELASAKGRRTVAVSQLIAGPLTTSLTSDEVIEAVRVPKLSPSARWGYCKLARKTGEFAYALAAAIVDPAQDFARVVMGAVEGKPIVVGDLSEVLLKRPSDCAALIAPAVARLAPAAEPFQQQALAAALRRAIEQASAS